MASAATAPFGRRELVVHRRGAMLDGQARQQRGLVGPQLGHQPGLVIVRRAGSDVEDRRSLLDGAPQAHQPKDLLFPRREMDPAGPPGLFRRADFLCGRLPSFRPSTFSSSTLLLFRRLFPCHIAPFQTAKTTSPLRGHHDQGPPGLSAVSSTFHNKGQSVVCPSHPSGRLDHVAVL